MSSADPDKARTRLIAAVRRISNGLRLQRARVLENRERAPRLLEGTPDEVVDLTAVPENDLDYYAYELGRLQDAARTVIKVFDGPAEIVVALDGFEAAVPKLREVRNPLTHPSDDARLDALGSFSALMHLRDDGSAEVLVDPRYQHHDAAEALAETLLEYLRAGLRSPG